MSEHVSGAAGDPTSGRESDDGSSLVIVDGDLIQIKRKNVEMISRWRAKISSVCGKHSLDQDCLRAKVV